MDRGGADDVGRGRLSGFGRERADAVSASGTAGWAARRREARVGGLAGLSSFPTLPHLREYLCLILYTI